MSLSEALIKPALAGSIGALAAYVLLGESGNIIVFGQQVPAVLAIGGTVAAANYLGELGHQYLLPMIPGNQKYAKIESALLSPALSGVAVYGIFMVAGINGDWFPAFALGAGSTVAADYAYNNFLEGYLVK